ncbi:MAG TPA: SIMPL domain-containing protein [Solirubrobacterales bacterium]|nr:SIMPL domain-containing protein [Solirubrobacterales bacterium]
MIVRRSLSLLAVMALALILPASASAVERTVTVKGSATQKVPNDTAKLGFSVSKERKSRGAALRVVAVKLRAVIAVVQATPGIGPGDVTTGQISVRKISRDKHTLFRASEGVGVVLHEPQRSGELVSAAVAAGATGTRGPDFFAGNPEAAYNNTLLAAFDQAKGKAATLATRAGAILGPAITIEETTEAVPIEGTAKAKGPQAGAEAPAPPARPGASTVTATVRVVFALE